MREREGEGGEKVREMGTTVVEKVGCLAPPQSFKRELEEVGTGPLLSREFPNFCSYCRSYKAHTWKTKKRSVGVRGTAEGLPSRSKIPPAAERGAPTAESAELLELCCSKKH